LLDLGGGGFLINTFLGVNEELPRTNGVFFGSFLGFLGVFGTPPKMGVFDPLTKKWSSTNEIYFFSTRKIKFIK
jgi:hypothetical protein